MKLAQPFLWTYITDESLGESIIGRNNCQCVVGYAQTTADEKKESFSHDVLLFNSYGFQLVAPYAERQLAVLEIQYLYVGLYVCCLCGGMNGKGVQE